MLLVKVNEGEEIIETITTYLAKKKITKGVVVSVIGALGSCALSSMAKTDPKKVLTKEYHVPLELSGNGEIIDGKPHLHVTLGQDNQKALHGHLDWGKVKGWFVHVYIIPL